jgi:hypothetical protein
MKIRRERLSAVPARACSPQGNFRVFIMREQFGSIALALATSDPLCRFIRTNLFGSA